MRREPQPLMIEIVGRPRLSVADEKTEHDQPNTDQPARRHHHQQSNHAGTPQSPIDVGEQYPEAGKHCRGKNAPTKMAGRPKEPIHRADMPSATSVSPAQTRSPVRTSTLTASGNSSTTVLPNKILPILWPRATASFSATHVSMRLAARLVIRRTAICPAPVAITRRFCTG